MGKEEREDGKGENLIFGVQLLLWVYKGKDYYISLCWKYCEMDDRYSVFQENMCCSLLSSLQFITSREMQKHLLDAVHNLQCLTIATVL